MVGKKGSFFLLCSLHQKLAETKLGIQNPGVKKSPILPPDEGHTASPLV